MHQRNFSHLLVSLTFVLCTFLELCGQQPSTPSHRFIPVGQKPTRDTFATPKFSEALKAFEGLRGTNRHSLTPTIPEFDASMAEDLSPEAKALLREWSRDSMQAIAGDIGNEISAFSESINADNSAEGQSESKLPFDFNRDVLQRYDKIVNNYKEQRKQRDTQYRQALEAFREKWPAEKLPPEQWLQQVQPFINAEVIEQLKLARDLRDGTASTPRLPTPPPETARPALGFSERMIESVVETLDVGGKQLLKRAQDNKSNKTKTPWWKRVQAKSKSLATTLNKAVTNRTEEYAQTRNDGSNRATSAPGKVAPTAALRLPITSTNMAILFSVLFAVALAIWARSKMRSANRVPLIALNAEKIRDRDSLLFAIHSIATTRFGPVARFWHHKKVLKKLQVAGEICEPTIEKIYERARYLGDSAQLSEQDYAEVQQWYSKVSQTVSV